MDREQLVISREAFLAHDLRKPLRLERRFDVAISLEVAEHLPAASADTFVATLVGLAPVLVFSAAVPEQGGASHLNEQWPEYWAKRFRAHGYIVIDCIRPRIWEDQTVDVWYAQNTLVYVAETELERYPRLVQEHQRHGDTPLAVVHPQAFLASIASAPERLTSRQIVAALPGAIARSARWRLRTRDERGA